MLIDIDLGHLQRAGLVGAEFIEGGGYRTAGPAPLGPEVDQDGQVGFQHFALPVVRCDRHNMLTCHGLLLEVGL